MSASTSLIEVSLSPAAARRDNTSPVASYLARLAKGSRRAQFAALNKVALLISTGAAGAYGLNWASLTYPQTAAVRTAHRSSRPN